MTEANSSRSTKLVYADCNATCPCSQGHVDDVMKLLKANDGNASSIHHFGRQAKLAVETARSKVAGLWGCSPRCIVFTSGATEGNNTVIQSLVRDAKSTGQQPRIVVTAGEHSSVRSVAVWLAEQGECETVVVPLLPTGAVDTVALLDAVDDATVLVAMIHVNNEVGAINPVEELVVDLKKRQPNVHVHIDAVQSFGKLDLKWIAESEVDSAVASAHKIGGFKGIGCLYQKVKKGGVRLLIGGGQERGRRAGTENVPGILSFGLRATEIAANPDWLAPGHKAGVKFASLLQTVPGAVIHGGDHENRVPTTINFHITGIDGDDLMLNLDLAGVAVSAGSACAAGVPGPSPVLKAMGLSDWEASNSIRVSFACHSTEGDAEYIVSVLTDIVKKHGQSNGVKSVQASSATSSTACHR